MSPNYSLYAIPAYVFTAMVPHVYSVVLLAAQKKRWDNVSPRSQKFAASIQKTVPPACLAKYERCRAAHNNMMENMAFFIGAVIVGNMVKLDSSFMNKSMLWYFISRAAYLLSYIQTESLRLSHLRSIIYTAGLVLLTVIYVKAGNLVVSETS